MSRVFLGIGSNIGDRIAYIKKALKYIGELQDTEIIKSSSIYRTEPWGYKEQGVFLNLVILIETKLIPLKLLEDLKQVEKKCGRIEREKLHEREVDIDILFFDDLVLKSEQLEIPHPLLRERKFVLIPLNEIDSDFIHPLFNESVKSLLDKTTDTSEVTYYKDKL